MTQAGKFITDLASLALGFAFLVGVGIAVAWRIGGWPVAIVVAAYLIGRAIVTVWGC